MLSGKNQTQSDFSAHCRFVTKNLFDIRFPQTGTQGGFIPHIILTWKTLILREHWRFKNINIYKNCVCNSPCI